MDRWDRLEKFLEGRKDGAEMLKIGDKVEYRGERGVVVEVSEHDWMGETLPEATVDFGWKKATIDQDLLRKIK